jgi:hypothetical protein
MGSSGNDAAWQKLTHKSGFGKHHSEQRKAARSADTFARLPNR